MSELDKIFVLLLIGLGLSVSIIGVVWYLAPDLGEISPQSEPIPEPDRKPVPIPYEFDSFSEYFEVIQGKSVSKDFNVTSVVHEMDATMKFFWNLRTYQDQSWSSTEPVPLEITFNPNQPILKYQEPKIITITITSADNAPLGEYKVIFNISASGPSNFSFEGPWWITVIP